MINKIIEQFSSSVLFFSPLERLCLFLYCKKERGGKRLVCFYTSLNTKSTADSWSKTLLFLTSTFVLKH